MSSPGAVVYCPECNAEFGGMEVCPWCDVRLRLLPDADPVALEFYRSIGVDYDELN